MLSMLEWLRMSRDEYEAHDDTQRHNMREDWKNAQSEEHATDCHICGDTIMYNEECVMLSLLIATSNAEGISFDYIRDVDGGIYTPSVVVELECYEGMIEELRTVLRDELPQEDQGRSPFICGLCGGGIRLTEPHMHAWQVEPRCADVSPSTVDADGDEVESENADYVRVGNRPDIMCIGCVQIMHDEVQEIWDTDLSYGGECATCTRRRCWRFGTCVCDCHQT